jgi:hypothetical protein
MMGRKFRRGDRVSWNSEAGRVTGVIVKTITSDTPLKGRIRHASLDHPQYVIRSDRTDHIAIHKGTALTKISPQRATRRTPARRPADVERYVK